MGLFQNVHQEAVQRLNLREPVICDEDQTVRQAVECLRERKLGCVFVVDGDRRPVGMFTEGMLKKLLVREPHAIDEPIRQHMANQVPWVRISDPISYVLNAMEEQNLRFMCVLDGNGRIAALTGQKGLMEYIADHFPGEVLVQRIGGKPYTDQREGA